ncbi:MAG: T9SS type A sorting domain-containing protein [Ignavibacteria bacterium]|nr:T9SS type A sorting domain-containing protein [Ignavibacteria bacterium]
MKQVAKLFCFYSMLTFLLVLPLFSQIVDSRGKDFWLTFLPNYHNYKYSVNEQLRRSDSIYIFISSDKPTTGKIEFYDINGNFNFVNFSITDPNQIYVFKRAFNDFELLGFNDMGNEWQRNMCEIPVKLSFHITSEELINVYAHSQGNKSSDAFLVLPTTSLGKEYLVLSYKSDGYFLSLSGRTPSQFAIVATENNTEVVIYPSGPTYVNRSEPQVVPLNKGEVYLVQALISENNPLNDLTGTYITANKPIAVFAGHQRATVPVEAFRGTSSPSRDFLCEQIPPIQAWGRNAFIVPLSQPFFITNRGQDIFRILAANDSTVVYINGSFLATLNRGQYYEGYLTQAATITATGAILVGVYKKTSNDAGASNISDPFMMIIPPAEQFIDSCKLINIQAYELEENLQYQKVYQEHFITIVVPVDAVGETKIDDVVVPSSYFREISGSKYYYAHVKVNEGKHSVQSNKPIGIFAYGYGPANSYGYIGGMFFAGKDWKAPELELSSDCFTDTYHINDEGDFSSGIDTVFFDPYYLRNVEYVPDKNFKKYNRRATIQFKLSNPYQDGSYKFSVRDSAGNVVTREKEIYGFTIRHFVGPVNNYQWTFFRGKIQLPFKSGLRIENFGKSDVEITKFRVVSKSTVNLLTPLPKIVKSKSTDVFEIEITYIPEGTDTIYFDFGNECIWAKCVAYVITPSDCDITEFEYKDFENPLKLNFVGNANKVEKYIQLTPPAVNRAGAVWYRDLVPVVSGFKTEFSFRVREGSNNNCEDGSTPGADGLAFVVQNFMPVAVGNYGGGIGYSGLPNSVAIEFDLFSNDSNQIENFFDPNGNHIAVQSNGRSENSPKHQPQFTLGMNTKIIVLKTDGTPYFAKIIYDEPKKVLEIFLDTTKNFKSPALTLTNFDLSKLIGLERGYRAYVGFTSATGCAYQSHELLSWHFCPTPPDPTRNVDDSPINFEELVYPNPIEDFAYINLSNDLFPVNLRIVNLLGETLFVGEHFSSDIPLDFRNIPIGAYIVEIQSKKTKYFKIVTKIR